MSTVETWFENWCKTDHKQNLSVLLSYAQSLDGCIARQRGAPTAISGSESLKVTHWLRSKHDALLVGVGTILADDPLLTVRLAAGASPIPIILDSRLETPLTSRLFQRADHKPWLFAEEGVNPERMHMLAQTGARIFKTPVCDDGRLDLDFVLQTLEQEGLCRLMVEGGARVITSFLTQQLADAVVITIAPLWLAGVAAPSNGSLEGDSSNPRIFNPQIEQRGDDFILFGSLSQGANQ